MSKGTTKPVSSTPSSAPSRRPFRIASRRRPNATTTTTSTTSTTNQPTTEFVESDEYLQDIEEPGFNEDPAYAASSGSRDKSKVQRRPLVNLKGEDQNIAATNEEEKKRQSKKYSSTFKQNQLDEVLRLKNQDAYDVDIDSTTEGKFTIESYSADTAVAIAAHKLLEAPVPIIPDYEYDVKPTRGAPSRSTQKFKYTETDYPREVTKTPSYPVAYSTTPSYSTRDYQTSTGTFPTDLLETVLPSTTGFKGSKPAGFTSPTITNPGLSGVSRDLGPSTVRYLSTTDDNVATHNLNPTDDRYPDSSENSKIPPSTVQYLSTVDKYTGVSYDLTPTSRYVTSSETIQTLPPTTRTRSRRPTTTEPISNEYTSRTSLTPDAPAETKKKYSEISRPTGPSTYRYLDTNTGYTGILQDPGVTNRYTNSGNDANISQTGGPSPLDYLDSRLTETAANLKTNRFTVTSEKYTEVPFETNPSTASYATENNKYYTRTPQEESPTSTRGGTSEFYTESVNTRTPTNRYTDRGESYTTLQNLRTTNTNTDSSDKYTTISRRRKPSTTTLGNSEINTTDAPRITNPTAGYTTTNERFTETSRRRRPSTNVYTETEYPIGILQKITTTESLPSTTERTAPSRRRRPSTNSYTSTEYVTESTPTYFTATSEKYTPPRRARPSTSKYDDVTDAASSEISPAGLTTGFTVVNAQFVETSPVLDPSTARYTDVIDKSTETQFADSYTTGRKYSEISRSRSSPTTTYLDSTEKHPTLIDDETASNRYRSPSQYTGIIQDLNPSTVKYRNQDSEDNSPNTSPSSKYPSTTGKYVSGPIDDYGFSTPGYSQSQEPSYFTREYLLASPVTKTYDDEYQYLSPVTTTQPTSTTKKLARKKMVSRRLSTTGQTSSTSTTTTPAPRIASRKPFEKVRKVQKVRKVLKVPKKTTQQEEVKEVKEEPETKVQFRQRQPVQRVRPVKKVPSADPNKVIRPIENYDYYDDSEEKVVQKYEEGTKVILHGKGKIECLDIGNFPHPSSCKKFISCARMEGGAFLGWEYVCPKGLSFDPVGGICNWSAGLGCHEQDS